jgi:hypothetical protein
VTDSGLQHLRRLTKLRQVNVRMTQVTSAGAKELQRNLPKAMISYGD